MSTTPNDAADFFAITQLLGAYVIAIDTRAPDLLTGCFTADATIDIGGGMPPMSVQDYIGMCRGSLTMFDATHHQLGLPAVKIEGNEAYSRCYLIAQHVKMALAPKAFLTIGAWYDDELTRTASGWRIRKRRGTSVWADGNPQVIGGAYPIGAFPPSAGRACPDWLMKGL